MHLLFSNQIILSPTFSCYLDKQNQNCTTGWKDIDYLCVKVSPLYSFDILHSLNKAKKQTKNRLKATSHMVFLAIMILTLSFNGTLWYMLYPLRGCQSAQTSTHIRDSTLKPLFWQVSYICKLWAREYFSAQVECAHKNPFLMKQLSPYFLHSSPLWRAGGNQPRSILFACFIKT